MADNTGYEEAKNRFEEAKKAYEQRGNASAKETQRLLSEYYKARRDMVERTSTGAFGAGMLRTAADTVFGLPDLVTEGVNWLAKKAGAEYQAPTLGGLFRQATGQSEGPKTEELSTAYNIPGYVATAYGVGSLAKYGWKAFKDNRLSKKADELLGELNPEQRNMFQQWMVRGQGSSSPEVAAMLEKVKSNPKYSEIFSALEKEAGKQALKGLKPSGSTQTPQEAATGIARTIQDKLDSVKTQRSTAGNEAFEKAFKQAGDTAFVETNNTRAALNKLRSEYPDNEGVLAYLNQLESKLIPSVTVASTKGTTVTRQGTPDRVIPGSVGYSTTEAGTASRTIPGSPSRTVTEPITVTKYDSLGMPYQTTEIRTRVVPATGGTTIAGTPGVTRTVPGSPSTTISGTPDVVMNIPGSAGYTTTQEPVKLTIQRLQGFLHEFGKKAEGSDSVVTGLSLDDMKRVNSTLFGGLKNDLADTVKTASDVSQKKAAGYLIQAREQFRKASEDYDNLIAQGVPKWLQGKKFNEVTIEDLTKAYQDTNPAQRQVFRDWVSENRAESLKVLDKAVFDDFLSDTYKKLPDGSFGYDLGSIADKWQKLKATDPNKAGQVADSLGINASEFSRRMKDASVFTKKIQIGSATPEGLPIPSDIKNQLAATVGASSAGYQGAKLAQISLEGVNEIFKKRGLSEEQLMKVILSPEGKDFLKNAALSPQSTKTLESLMKVDNFLPPATVPSVIAAISPTAAPVSEQSQPAWELPPDMLSEPTLESPPSSSQWELPPDLEVGK